MSAATLPPNTAAGAVAHLTLPASGRTLVQRRDEHGQLHGLTGGGRTYVREEDRGVRHLDDVATVREQRTGDALVRVVTTRVGTWVERYRWSGARLVHVDGVEVRRDERGRVVACDPGGHDPAPPHHRFAYGWTRDHLAVVSTPTDTRHITAGPDGRPQVVRSEPGGRTCLRYDRAGIRHGLPTRPTTWHLDAAGRLWEETDADGRVVTTWLWDGTYCFGRIDGPLGDPLAAVLSLDPSGTPVRVIRRDGTNTRVPRDAFGETLLDVPGVPGLFGGAVHGGIVHLPYRRLDPRLGAFCEPDPFDGGPADPRRGPDVEVVGVEPGGTGGPYAVCRGDPVGRTDPTGAISVPLLLSTVTWSSMNNVVSFVGMDWFVNLLLSLLTLNRARGDVWSSDALSSSDRLGSFGVRRDGIIAPERAFATQHIIWSPASSFDDIAAVRVVVPGGPWEPTAYGTVLRVDPDGAPPRVLQGARRLHRDSTPAWSRVGGPARPAAPGAVRPVFPEGGLHLDRLWDDVLAIAPRAAQLTELRPADGVATGDLDVRTIVELPPDAAPPTTGDDLLASDSGDGLAITTVVSVAEGGGRATLRLEHALPDVGPTGVRLRRLESTPSSDEDRPAGAVADSLDARGGAEYATDDLVVVRAAGGETGAARVSRAEARVPLERPLPADWTGPIRVRATTAGAPVPAIVAAPRELTFAEGSAPAVGEQALVGTGGQHTAVAVVAAPDGTRREVDGDLTGVTTAGGAVTWEPLSPGPELGARAEGPEGGALLTYTPVRPGGAPDGSGGVVALRFDAVEGAAVRIVTGAPAHDVIVLDRPLPAGGGPYRVTRHQVQVGGFDRSGLAIRPATALVLDTPPPEDVTGALRLLRLRGDPPDLEVRLPGAARSDRTLAATTDAPPSEPRPGDLVSLGSVGGELAVVERIEVEVDLDRDVAAAGDRELRIVLLALDGPAWAAEVRAADRLRLDGMAYPLDPSTGMGDPTVGTVEVDLPRIRLGETVLVRYTVGAQTHLRSFSVVDVAGTTLRLQGGASLAGGTDVSVRRLVPADPGTGCELAARDGEALTPSRLRCAVWRPDALIGRHLGIVVGDRTVPARVTHGSDVSVRIVLTETPATTAATIDLAVPAVEGAATVARWTVEDRVVITPDPVDLGDGDLADDTIAAVRLVPDGDPVPSTLSSGTVLVPEDEQHEIDRRQSLVDHELTHTLQYGRLGPWWFAVFPLWALDLGLEAFTDADLPTFTAFVEGTYEPAADRPNEGALTVADTGTLSPAVGDDLQVVRGSSIATVTVVAMDDDRVRVRHDPASRPTAGGVHVRGMRGTGTWWAGGIYNALQLTTHGGLVNLAGTGFAGLAHGIGRLLYAAGRAIFGTDRSHPATIADGGTPRTVLHLGDDDARATFAPFERLLVLVRSGEQAVTRRATHRDGVLTLDVPLEPAFDDVRVSVHDTHDPSDVWNWWSYHPAQVPDPDLPHRVELLAPEDAPSFAVNDRVAVQHLGTEFRTTVIAVSGSTLELQTPVDLRGGERTVRVARIAGQDPITTPAGDRPGNWDSAASSALGMSWLKYLTDPWGQLHLAVAPENRFADVLLRTGRYLFGSRSWSVLPAFGWVFWDRLFRADSNAFRSRIEQEASEESGDLYSSLGRLTGETTAADGFARRRMVVGDVARYRFWPVSRSATFVVRNRLGGPGVHLDVAAPFTDEPFRTIRIVPHRASGVEPDVRPNATTGPDAAATDPNRTVPNVFAPLDPDRPGALWAFTPGPAGVAPDDLAFVPGSPTLQRTLSAYVAFSRPGTHRVTVRNDRANELLHPTTGEDEDPRGTGGAQDVQGRGRQSLFFDIEATPVTVTVAGIAVDDGDHLVLVPTQAAAVTVAPTDGGRTYAVTVPDPADGPVTVPDDGLRLVGRGIGASDVEVSRRHIATATGYTTGGLAAAGRHLGGDVHVPVRRVTVDVVDTLVPLGDPSPGFAPDPADLAAGGTVFVLVPAPIADPLRVVSVDGAPPEPTETPAIEVVDADAPTRAFLGADGQVFAVRAPATAPGADRTLHLEVRVGPAPGTPLHCEVRWRA